MSTSGSREQIIGMMQTNSDLSAKEMETLSALLLRHTGIAIPTQVEDSRSLPGRTQYKFAHRLADLIGPVVARGESLSQSGDVIKSLRPKP